MCGYKNHFFKSSSGNKKFIPFEVHVQNSLWIIDVIHLNTERTVVPLIISHSRLPFSQMLSHFPAGEDALQRQSVLFLSDPHLRPWHLKILRTSTKQLTLRALSRQPEFARRSSSHCQCSLDLIRKSVPSGLYKSLMNCISSLYKAHC